MDKRQEKDKVDYIVGRNVYFIRETRRISRDELATMLGLTTSHLGLIERGARGATAVTLSKLSKIFNIHVGNFFDDSKYVSPEDDPDADSKIKKLKINSVLTTLSERDLDVVLHLVKGLMVM